jgi:hypothetical protein
MRILIRIQGFDDQKFLQNYAEKFFYIENCRVGYLQTSIKDVHATGEAFNP